jgi:uncharacterized protein with HEPN domain
VKDDRLYLKDVIRCAERILAYTAGGREEFVASTLIQDAVIRNFEIIGEAVKQISSELKAAHPEVEWRPIARFRDLLIHHYMGVDLNEVWNIVVGDLPDLRQHAERILDELGPAP